VGGEHLQPLVDDELARIRQVARAELVDLDEIGDPLRIGAHGTGSIFSSNCAVPVSGMYGCFQISTANDMMINEYNSLSSRNASSGSSSSGNISRYWIASSPRGDTAS